MDTTPPPDFVCPIGCEFMRDPVVLAVDGCTYEREALDVVTEHSKTAENLKPNVALKSAIDSWVERLIIGTLRERFAACGGVAVEAGLRRLVGILAGADGALLPPIGPGDHRFHESGVEFRTHLGDAVCCSGIVLAMHANGSNRWAQIHACQSIAALTRGGADFGNATRLRRSGAANAVANAVLAFPRDRSVASAGVRAIAALAVTADGRACLLASKGADATCSVLLHHAAASADLVLPALGALEMLAPARRDVSACLRLEQAGAPLAVVAAVRSNNLACPGPSNTCGAAMRTMALLARVGLAQSLGAAGACEVVVEALRRHGVHCP